MLPRDGIGAEVGAEWSELRQVSFIGWETMGERARLKKLTAFWRSDLQWFAPELWFENVICFVLVCFLFQGWFSQGLLVFCPFLDLVLLRCGLLIV